MTTDRGQRRQTPRGGTFSLEQHHNLKIQYGPLNIRVRPIASLRIIGPQRGLCNNPHIKRSVNLCQSSRFGYCSHKNVSPLGRGLATYDRGYRRNGERERAIITSASLPFDHPPESSSSPPFQLMNDTSNFAASSGTSSPPPSPSQHILRDEQTFPI